MNDNILGELLEMVQMVNTIYNKDKKCEEIHKIVSYGSFLYYTGKISSKEFSYVLANIRNNIECENYYNAKNECLLELINNNELIKNFFNNYCLSYSDFIIKEKKENINKDIKNIFIEFLKYVKCYDLFCLLKNSNQISYQSINHSLCLDNRNDSFIVIKHSNSFHQYLDLSHEIGHAYENKILSSYKKYFDLKYTSEIISITFNRIFIEFLYLNDVITKEEYLELMSNFEMNYYNFIHNSLFISQSICTGYYNIYDYDISIFREEDILNYCFTDYNYAIGRIVCFNLFNEWLQNDSLFIKNLPQKIRDIYNMNITQIIENYGNNTDLIKKEFTKYFIKNK